MKYRVAAHHCENIEEICSVVISINSYSLAKYFKCNLFFALKMIAACLPCGIFLPPCSMEFETCGVYDTKYRERNNIAYCFCFVSRRSPDGQKLQPVVLRFQWN